MLKHFGPFIVTNSTEPSLYKRKNGNVVLCNAAALKSILGSPLPKEGDEVPQLEYELEFKPIGEKAKNLTSRVWISTLDKEENLFAAYVDISVEVVDTMLADLAIETMAHILKTNFPPVTNGLEKRGSSYFFGGKL